MNVALLYSTELYSTELYCYPAFTNIQKCSLRVGASQENRKSTTEQEMEGHEQESHFRRKVERAHLAVQRIGTNKTGGSVLPWGLGSMDM